MKRKKSPTRRALERSHYLLLFLLLSVVLLRVPHAQAWGWDAHRLVASEAISLLPENVRPLFSANSTTIVEWSVKPDELKGSDPYEQYRHWYHVNVPHDEQRYQDGVLPWAVQGYFENLVLNLEWGNWREAAELAGRISHYTADASMPLHATSDYNPCGKHTAFEMEADRHLGEMDIKVSGYAPAEVKDVFGFTMQLLEDSFWKTGELSDQLCRGSLWSQTLKGVTEERLREAVKVTADIWYTAITRAIAADNYAAAPSLASPKDGAVIRESSLTFAWSSVNDLSPPVAYQLVVDDSADFSSPEISENLSGPRYSTSIKLEDGTYYWRVLVRDGAGNENMSVVFRFTVSTGPSWAVLVATIVVVAAAALAVAYLKVRW